MNARTECAPAVALALAVSAGCDIARPPDLHPDVVALAVLLFAGESEARMLAIHPHRGREDAAPNLTATFEGPGWTAAFDEMSELGGCKLTGEWLGPSKCLRAKLPEAIRPGGTYRLRGTAPLGTFTGEAVVPAPPHLLEPGDSLHVVEPDNDLAKIPIRYKPGPDVGTLLVEALDFWETQDDGSEEELPWHTIWTPDGLETDTVGVFGTGKPMRFSLRMLGIGWHYTDFVEHGGEDLLTRPWPASGIEGEGVYGFFDGVTPSRAAQVFVSPESTEETAMTVTEAGTPP